MPRLILHIGTHKTGTTSVQDQMSWVRASLARKDVVYPDLSPHTGHHGLLTDWIKLPRAYDLPEGGRHQLRELAETFRGTGQTIFLSSEEFSREGGPGGRVDFAELRAIFSNYETTVLCVLREPISFLQSVYLEISRHKLPARPPEFLASALSTGQADGLWWDYGRLYQRLRQDFAADEIRLINYEAAKAAPSGVIGRLLDEANIHVEEHLDLLPWSNLSPGILPRWAAQVVAGWTVPNDPLILAAQEAFDLEFGDLRQSLFTQEERVQAAKVINRWTASFSASLAKDQKAFDLSRWQDSSTLMDRSHLTAEYWIRLARRLSFQLGQAA